MRKARAGYHPLAGEDVPLKLKRPCRFCQVARYAAIVTAIIIWYATVRDPIGSTTALPTEIQQATPVDAGSRTLPGFSLTSHHGAPFDDAALDTTWSVISIGYRACETHCPQTLSAMAQARQALLEHEPSSANWHWLMITLDPESDTARHLSDYLSAFSDTLTGLTGDVESLTRVVSVLTGSETPLPGQVWLVAPGGDIRAQFDPPLDPDALTSDLRLLRRQFP